MKLNTGTSWRSRTMTRKPFSSVNSVTLAFSSLGSQSVEDCANAVPTAPTASASVRRTAVEERRNACLETATWCWKNIKKAPFSVDLRPRDSDPEAREALAYARHIAMRAW